MKLTIMDQNEHIVTTLSSGSFQAESAPVLSASLQEVLNDKHVLTFETTAAGIEAQNILEEYYVIAKVNGQYREFVIKEITDSDDTDLLKNVKAMLSSVELNDELITTEIKGAADAQTALAAIVKGTRWSVGYVDPSIYNNQFTEKVQFQSVLEAIYTLSNFYNCDVHFSYVVNDLKVTARKVNLYRQLGTEAGKRFEIDKDITSIERTVDTTAIKTAIYPVRITEEDGKQTITTVADVVWSKAAGNPADKPKGQPWVGDPAALKNWGRVNSDGTLRHRFKLYEYNEDVSPETMLQMAWVSLGQYTQPKVTYEAKVVDLYQLTGTEEYKHETVSLGDTCVVIDRYFSIPIETVDRVIEINRDLLEAENTVVTLGTKKDSYTSNRESDMDYAYHQSQSAKDLAESAATSANGKNTNYYGSLEPKYPNKGDSWIRPHPENPEETQWLIWDGVQWVVEIDTTRINEVEKLAEQAESEAQAAIAEANTATGTALDAHNKALEAAANVASLEGKVAYVQTTLEDKASKSQVTQLADQITSVVTTVDGHSSQIVQLSNQITSVVTSVNAIDKKLSWNEISAATNLNNMNSAGHFFMKGTLTNSPVTAPAYLTVDTVATTNIKQTIQKDNSADIYYRTYKNGVWSNWERGATYSQITQMEDLINLKVAKNDVVNQINISTEGILISGKKIQITGDTYIQNGIITSAKIASLEADKITAGTLNAANVRVINLDANNIVTGTISGANLSINLNTGVVNFQKGMIQKYDGQFSIDVTNGRVSSKSSGQDREVLIYDGNLSASNPSGAVKISGSELTFNSGEVTVNGTNLIVRKGSTPSKLIFGNNYFSFETATIYVTGASVVGATNLVTTPTSGTAKISGIQMAGTTGSNPYVHLSTGAGNYGVSAWQSDMRLKTAIKDCGSLALEKVNELKVREFNWAKFGEHIDFGLIAQEVETVYPEAVFEVGGYKQLRAEVFIPLLIKAVQELERKLENGD